MVSVGFMEALLDARALVWCVKHSVQGTKKCCPDFFADSYVVSIQYRSVAFLNSGPMFCHKVQALIEIFA